MVSAVGDGMALNIVDQSRFEEVELGCCSSYSYRFRVISPKSDYSEAPYRL